jgi:hypothetical protein
VNGARKQKNYRCFSTVLYVRPGKKTEADCRLERSVRTSHALARTT